MSDTENQIVDTTPTESTETNETNVAPVDEKVDGENQSTESTTKESEVDYSKNVKKRIDKLATKLNQKEQELEQLRQQLQNREQPAPSQQAQQQVDNKPKMADFDTIEDFTEALAEWKYNNISEKQQIQQVQQQKAQSYNQKVEQFMETAPDFVLAVNEIDHVIQRDPLAFEFIFESDVGPQLAYHLANHQDELNKIMQLSPTRRIAALGRIENELISKSKSTIKTQKVPEPIGRVTSNSSNAKEDGSPKDYNAWKKWRQKR